MLNVAKKQFGDPYVYGAAGPSAFDCSGYTLYVYRQATGLSLPHRADSQYYRSTKISRSEARPGDLVFFNTQRRAHSHVGIYIGDGRFVHSPSAGQQVRVEHMATPYWARRFDGARRATGS